MSKVLFATSMDPFHLGHCETVLQLRESLGTVVVGLGINPEKPRGLFTQEERIHIAKLSLPEDVEVLSYEGPTLAFAQSIGATALGRGLRSGNDLEYEAALQFQNEALAEELGYRIPTQYALTTKYPLVSSSRVRELLHLRVGRAVLERFLHEKTITWLIAEGYQALNQRQGS